MGIIFKGDRNMVQTKAGRQQGRVKGFPVECNKGLRGRKELGDRFEHGGFLGGVAHEKLLQNKLILYKTCDTHHESIGACSTRESRCLCIEKGKLGKRYLG